MLTRRDAILTAIAAAIAAAHPRRAVALPEDPKKIPVNPNPQDIVNGPTVVHSREVSYAEIKRVAGSVKVAADICRAIGIIIGAPSLAISLLGFVSKQFNLFKNAVNMGSTSHGLKITYSETVRYYVNPATGHKEYYETSYGLRSVSKY